MADKIERLAAALAEAWRSGTTVPLPAPDAAPASRAEAYAVQDRMAELIGEPVVGWKVGATVRAVQRLEGHDGPILGRLFGSRLMTSPATVPAALVEGGKLECEIAFRFTADLPARRDRRYAPEEIAPLLVLHPAIELTASRYAAGARRPTTFDVVADNGNAGALVVGPGVEDWRDLALGTLPIEARIDGGEAIEVYGGEFRLDRVEAVIDTASELAARGIGFSAGQYLSTGSLTLPTPLRAGQTLVARFEGLGTLEVALG